MICAIHQPNLVPWYPFFQKMAACDVFVLLTQCQFERQGYQNRFNIGANAYTMPVFGVDKRKPIHRMEYVEPAYNWRKLSKQLAALGKRYEHRAAMLSTCISPNLADTNANIICEMASWLGIRATILTDEPTEKTGTARLVEICEHVGADVYLSGPSGRDYLDEPLFAAADIAIQYQDADKQKRIHTLEMLCA